MSDGKAKSYVAVRILAVVFLVWALASHPIGYYTFLRFLVCATCAYGAYRATQLEQWIWAWAMAIVAFLFNPIVPIYLQREVWKAIDVITAGFLLVSIPFMRSKTGG